MWLVIHCQNSPKKKTHFEWKKCHYGANVKQRKTFCETLGKAFKSLVIEKRNLNVNILKKVTPDTFIAEDKLPLSLLPEIYNNTA